MSRLLEFGPFRLNETARILTRGGSVIAITPKAFDTLLYLVSRAGETVGREEIIRTVWPDTIVEDGNLNFNISQIRKALGDFEPGQSYIQTIPKQGYRFIAGVSEVSQGRTTRPPRFAIAALLLLIAGGGLAWWRVRTLRPVSTASANSKETGPPLVRVTSDSGLNTTPAFSPDGRLIAYASDRGGGGNLNLWVQLVDSGQMSAAPAIRLTNDGADDYAPSFSPDGRSIAFRSERNGGGVYVIPAGGGPAKEIAPRGRRPRFSPDGKWIAYWIGAETGDTSSFFMVPGSGRIFIMPAVGGVPRELRSDFAAAGYPIWTPDSRHILFLGNRAPNEYHEETMDWWVTPIDGGPAVATGARAVFRDLGLSSPSQAPETWAADGSGVLMSAALADTRNLWSVPISQQDWKVSAPPKRLTWGTTLDVQPSAADGRVAFASMHEELAIWSLPLDPNKGDANRGVALGKIERLTSDAFAHSYPAVSSDGTKLAFCSRAGGGRDVWVKDLASGKERVVSGSPGPSFNPVFSPDGRALVYRSAENKTSIAYLAPLDGGGVKRLREDCTDYGWSADGKRLLIVGKTPARVSVLELDSGHSRPLLDHASYVLWNARFSPDDKWISFNATAPGSSSVYVAPMDEAGRIPESRWIAIAQGSWEDKPRWSPDGSLLYFISERDGFRCIWSQRLDARKHPAGDATAVFHAHEARRSLSDIGIGDVGISVARDKIVFNMNERTGNLWFTSMDGRR